MPTPSNILTPKPLKEPVALNDPLIITFCTSGLTLEAVEANDALIALSTKLEVRAFEAVTAFNAQLEVPNKEPVMLPDTLRDPVIVKEPLMVCEPVNELDPVVKYLPSIVVSLVLTDPEVVAKLDDTTAKLADAVVNILAVDSRLVVLVDKEPDAEA